MRQLHWKSLTLSIALGLAAVGTANLHAQNRPDDQRDQGSAPSQNAQPPEHSRDRAPSRATQPPSENAHPNERIAERGNSDDTVTRYRKAHPHAAARCHDGFFTNTADRSRACSKHGGLDVWLQL
jgi:hypothetical protein